LRWQRVARNTQLIGAEGLARVIEQLQGFETAAGAWEREVLPARLHGYDQTWLDQLCLAGQGVWCRLSPRRPAPQPATEPATHDEVADGSVAGMVADGEPRTDADAASRSPDLRPDRGRRAVRAVIDRQSEPYNLAEAGAEAARLAGGTRPEIA